MGDIELACHTSSWGPGNLVAGIAEIAQCGYRGIEGLPNLVDTFEDRHGILAEILSEQGLSLVAILSPSGPISSRSLDEEIERNLNITRFLKAMRAPFLVVYAPRVGEEEEIDEEDYAAAAEAINELGRRTKEMGVTTCLHPELGTLCESNQEMLKMMKLTDASSVSLCPDTGHLQAINVSAASFFRDHHARIPYMHFKDVRRVKRTRVRRAGRRRVRAKPLYCEIGRGRVNFSRLVEAMTTYDYEGWVTVELDPPVRSPAASARVSLDYSNRKLDLVF